LFFCKVLGALGAGGCGEGQLVSEDFIRRGYDDGVFIVLFTFGTIEGIVDLKIWHQSYPTAGRITISDVPLATWISHESQWDPTARGDDGTTRAMTHQLDLASGRK
jgi:hypothetical protein